MIKPGKLIILFMAVLFASCGRGCGLSSMPSLPGIGLSGLYAGCLDGKLVVAGGCNFPDKPVTEGGRKKFYDEIWTLEGDAWRLSGHLPAPSAYAAYVSRGDTLFVIGGADTEGTHDTVWALTEDGITALQPLPKPIEQAAWCDSPQGIYVAGGLSNGDGSLGVFLFDGSVWTEVAQLPRPIVQGIAMVSGGRLCIWGGYDPSCRYALTCGYALDPESGIWDILPDAGVTFVGSSIVGGFAFGGCDATVMSDALKLSSDKVREYQSQPQEYYRFRGEVLRLDADTMEWDRVIESGHLARAGAAVAQVGKQVIFAGGEIKPGVRTPEVWSIGLGK